MKFTISNLKDLPDVVKQVIPLLEEAKIFLVYGEMGVGKTTFVQELLRQMGISHPEGSPTYSLVNEYFSEKFGKIYHLDLYRLKTEEEAYDIGIEEIIDGNSFCFIEWPEKIHSFIQSTYFELIFELKEDLKRQLEIKKKSFHN